MGWRNNYSVKTKSIEVIGKDLKFAFSDLGLWLKNGFQLPSIVVYPDFPSKKTTIFKIAKRLGYRITNKPIPKPKLVIYFEDITHGDTSTLKKIYKSYCLNENCFDISKRQVDKIHMRVFGYNTFIDPIQFSGKAVQKSDTNALHDGKIIDCPIEQILEGSVYQILLDNQADKDFVVDYRVPVMRQEIPLIYKKFKPIAVRFTNDVSHSTIHKTDDEFTIEEQKKIKAFAAEMNADFCELDIIRHNDGRIFIIDVNKTPYGPPSGLKEKDLAVNLLSEAFKKVFLT